MILLKPKSDTALLTQNPPVASLLTPINNSILSDLKSHVFYPADISTATLTSCSSNSTHLRAFALVPAGWNALAADIHRFTPSCCSGRCSNVTLSERSSLTTLCEIAIYDPLHLCLFTCFFFIFLLLVYFLSLLTRTQLFESRDSVLYAAVSQHLTVLSIY